MSRPRQLGKIVSPPPSCVSPAPFAIPDEKGSSSLSESIGRHEQKPWEPHIRERPRVHVYTCGAHGTPCLYVYTCRGERERGFEGLRERRESTGERWNRARMRERRPGAKEGLVRESGTDVARGSERGRGRRDEREREENGRSVGRAGGGRAVGRSDEGEKRIGGRR